MFKLLNVHQLSRALLTFTALLLPLLLSFLLLAKPALAQPSEQSGTTAEVLKIAMPDNYRPFYYRDNNRFAGISYDITHLMLTRLGYEVVTVQYNNMNEALKKITNGDAQIIANLTDTPSRKVIALFTNTPHIFETQDLIVRANTQPLFDGQLPKLSSYKFGSIYGWTHGPQFDNAEYLNKVFVADSKAQLLGLLSGKFDIAINNRLFFHQLSQEMAVSNAFKALNPPLFSLPVKIAVSKQYPKAERLISQLNQQLRLLLLSPDYQELLKKYRFKTSDNQQEVD